MNNKLLIKISNNNYNKYNYSNYNNYNNDNYNINKK